MQILSQQIAHTKATDSDFIRRVFILKVLLTGYIPLAGCSFIISLHNAATLGRSYDIPAVISTLGLFIFSIITYYIGTYISLEIGAWIFVCCLAVPALFLSYQYGALVVQAALLYALVVVVTGILINPQASLWMTFCIGIYVSVIAYLQSRNILNYDRSWFQNFKNIYNLGDAIPATLTLAVISLVSWLSNRELYKALAQIRLSEKKLKQERDLLDSRVKKRTKALENEQLARLLEVNRFASFGRLSSGLIHDIINPLQAVSLSLQNIQLPKTSEASGEIVQAAHIIQNMIKDTRIMEQIISAARKQYQNQQVVTTFSPQKEIEQVIDVLANKAKNRRINILFLNSEFIEIKGNPIKFGQVMTNIISNALDAFPQSHVPHERSVTITLRKEKNLLIEIKDTGVGIPSKFLPRIFEPLFTTKSIEQGTGIGLYICKEIVEKEFNGTIDVKTKIHTGTSFTISLPI